MFDNHAEMLGIFFWTCVPAEVGTLNSSSYTPPGPPFVARQVFIGPGWPWRSELVTVFIAIDIAESHRNWTPAPPHGPL
jgi:hypothetical protein